jgi:hypothetical protein
MTRSAAISIAILALVALALIMLLGRHGVHAASAPTGDELTALVDPCADQRHGSPKIRLELKGLAPKGLLMSMA